MRYRWHDGFNFELEHCSHSVYCLFFLFDVDLPQRHSYKKITCTRRATTIYLRHWYTPRIDLLRPQHADENLFGIPDETVVYEVWRFKINLKTNLIA